MRATLLAHDVSARWLLAFYGKFAAAALLAFYAQTAQLLGYPDPKAGADRTDRTRVAAAGVAWRRVFFGVDGTKTLGWLARPWSTESPTAHAAPPRIARYRTRTRYVAHESKMNLERG